MEKKGRRTALSFILAILSGCSGIGHQIKPDTEIKARSFNGFTNSCSLAYQGLIRWPSTVLTYIRMDGKFREKIMLTETIANNSKA